MSGTPRHLLLGDTHGNLQLVDVACRVAVQNGVSTIIQLGDWGFVWPGQELLLLKLDNLLGAHGVKMIFIDGNHDWHERLPGVNQTHNLVYAPRGASATLTEGGPRLSFLGGAASIDLEDRREGHDWWPTETITDDDVRRVAPCDVLLTHDAPALPPGLPLWPFPVSLRVQAALDRSREQVAAAVRRAKPRRLYHGHYHYRYETDFEGVKVIGLDCSGPRSRLLVDEQFEPV